jgi:hypothetical protein
MFSRHSFLLNKRRGGGMVIPEHIEISRQTAERLERITHLPAQWVLEDYELMSVIEKKMFPNESWDETLFRIFSEWH